MEYIREISISIEKFAYILMLSRLANEDELLPTYEPREEDINDLCPAISFMSGFEKRFKHDIAENILN